MSREVREAFGRAVKEMSKQAMTETVEALHAQRTLIQFRLRHWERCARPQPARPHPPTSGTAAATTAGNLRPSTVAPLAMATRSWPATTSSCAQGCAMWRCRAPSSVTSCPTHPSTRAARKTPHAAQRPRQPPPCAHAPRASKAATHRARADRVCMARAARCQTTRTMPTPSPKVRPLPVRRSWNGRSSPGSCVRCRGTWKGATNRPLRWQHWERSLR